MKWKGKKRVWISAVSSITTLLPIVAVIACGNKQNLHAITLPNDNKGPTTTIDNGKYTINNINADIAIKPFSVTTLSEEAKKINDSSEWVGGLAMHAASSAVAFIKNLAESYGYSTNVNPVTGQTPRQKFITDNHYTFIDNENRWKVLDNNNVSPEVKFMASLHERDYKLTKWEKRRVLQTIGNKGGMNNTISDFADETNGHLKNYNIAYDGPFFGTQEYTAYPDFRYHGAANVTIWDRNAKVVRQVIIPNIIDAYPKLSDEELNSYAPLLKYMLCKFLALFENDKDVLKVAPVVSAETIDQLQFLINQNIHITEDSMDIKKMELEINDAEWHKHLVMLNNGSTHWLAIKAILMGLDNSFLKNGFGVYAGDKQWPVMSTDTKQGIGDADSLLFLQSWGTPGRFCLTNDGAPYSANDTSNPDYSIVRVDEENYYHATFIAGKTVSELDALNGFDADHRQKADDEESAFYAAQLESTK